jgi:threonine dehydrogenase-like Zn-dependent dehydrogenase
MAVPFADSFALPIPEGVSDEAAVLLTDILPTGYLGALRADIRPGSTVAIIGLGPVGVMAFSARGCSVRRGFSPWTWCPNGWPGPNGWGAEPIDARLGSASEQVLEATSGRGAPSVIETVGADRTILEASRVPRPEGPCRSSA